MDPIPEQAESDEELMMQFAHQDNVEAFNMLYLRYKTALYRFVLRFVYPPANAEEVFQDIWANIIQAKTDYTIRALFRTYLYTIARNRITDFYRRNKIKLVTDETEINVEMNTSDNSPLQLTEKQTLSKLVMQAVMNLSQQQKEAFLLKEQANLSIAEIAQVTGVNHETAKSRYRYAIKSLRKTLEGQNHD